MNLVPDSLLATGIVLVNLSYVLEPETNKIEEEQKVTSEQHESTELIRAPESPAVP